MSGNYIPLYRKYRPQSLEEIVGQEHVKKTLTSAIELGKISHAYLFTGPRGTGKTSTARILAKSLNCKNGPTVHPCGQCESCKDITNAVPIDVIEIDAASNRKVEDAQNLLEKIQYVPVNGKYKIYIIDEVHMLSTHAFNALLKTLEEPPENVIFILATTEVHKVLDTIKSRCQRYDFRRITTEDIVKHLRYIADNENINIDNEALFAIAKNSAGGMRDSISLLDQLSILGISKQIVIDDVNSILGRLSFDVLNELTSKIISQSHTEAIEILNEIYNSGNEPLQILTNLCEYFKNMLMAKTCAKDLLPELTGLNSEQLKEIISQTADLEVQQIVFLIERTSYYIKEIKLASNQHLWLEVGIIDLSNMTENTALINLQNRVKILETGSIRGNNSQPDIHKLNAPAKKESNKQSSRNNISNEVSDKAVENKQQINDEFTPPPISKKTDENDIQYLWTHLLENISSPSTLGLLKQLAKPAQLSNEGVVITFKSEKWASSMNEESKRQIISDAVRAVFGKDVPLTIKAATETETIKQTVIKKNSDSNEIKQTDNDIISEKSIDKADEKKIENNSDSVDSLIKSENKTATDQEKMIMDLFDGKYVE